MNKFTKLPASPMFLTLQTCQRPPALTGTGISPMRWDEALKMKALRDFNADEIIDL